MSDVRDTEVTPLNVPYHARMWSVTHERKQVDTSASLCLIHHQCSKGDPSPRQGYTPTSRLDIDLLSA